MFDAVVIGTIASVVITIAVGAVIIYKVIKLIGEKSEDE